MPEIRISLASPLLALRGGWEAGTMNHHTPIMETLHPSSRKRVRSDVSNSDGEKVNTHTDDECSQANPDENLPKFIVMKPTHSEQP